MRLTTTSAIAILAYSSATAAAPTVNDKSSNSHGLIIKRLDFDSELAELEAFRAKRESFEGEIAKREYKIVTDVLSAIRDTELAPQILDYFIESPTFSPIVISVILAVLKSGALSLTTLFTVLDQSNLIGKVVTDLISDCSLYVDLFNIAKQYIGNLIPLVQNLISSGLSSLNLRDQIYEEEVKRDLVFMEKRSELAERDLQDVVVNLLESLANSGLASQVVKALLTDPEFYPFAVILIGGVLSTNALPLSEIIDALKNTNLVGDLLKQILTANTFTSVVTNAFAAFAGTCAASNGYGNGGTSTPSTGGSGGSSGGSIFGGGSGSGNGGTTIVQNPCKRRRRAYY